MCIYPIRPPQASYDIRSIFKQSKVGLNSVFFLPDNLPEQDWRTVYSIIEP